MSASHAVAPHSSSQTQTVNNTDPAAAQSPENQAAGDVFQQMLLEMLSTNLENPDSLQDLLSGVELPASGETLPSEELLSQLADNGLDKEQLSGLFELLGIADPEAEVNAEELLATIQQQLQQLDPQSQEQPQSPRLTPEQLLHQAQAAAESVRPAEVPVQAEADKPQEPNAKQEADTVEPRQPQPQAVETGLSVAESVRNDEAVDVPRPSRNQPAADGAVEVESETVAAGEQVAVAGERRSEVNPPRSEVAERVLAAEPQVRAEVAGQADRQSEQRPDVEQAQRSQQQQVTVDASLETRQTVAAAPVAVAASDAVRQVAATESRADARVATQEIQNNTQQTAANTADTEQSGDDSDNLSRRSQQFREGLATMRSEIQAAARELADNAPRSANNLGNTFVMPGQAASSEISNRPATMPSGFQQLQQLYSGQTSAQVTLAAGARFGEQNWAPNMAQRISWMANQQVGRADIQLDPPELGALHIRLSIQNDQASVSFTSPHAQVRDALEQQMPRLREMLEESGLQLEQSDVSDQSASQNSEQFAEEGSGAGGSVSDRDEERPSTNLMAENANLSLVDYYA